MRRQLASLTLMICGVIALVLSVAVVPAPTPVSARPLLQPSPRPPLQPTPDFRQDDNGPRPTIVPTGRVTGTVIDLRTGSPAPGVLVLVGETLVITDANGNYDRWVTSGFYQLGLQLRAGEGDPTQPAQEIAVGAGDTVVVHLFFTSPAPAAPLAQPTAPAAPLAPTAVLALPPDLPDTSRDRPMDTAVPMPASLPVTAATSAMPSPWLLVGALLFGVGLLLQAAPRRRRGARRPAPAAVAARPMSDDPVAALLRAEQADRDQDRLGKMLDQDVA